MKTLVKTFAVVALLITTSLARAEDNNADPKKTMSFEIGLFQSKNSMKMNVIIEKTADKDLIVRLRDSKGEILVTEHVNKKDTSYHAKYDMSELVDGKYTFEFTQGRDKMVKEVNLVTTKPTEINRQITLN